MRGRRCCAAPSRRRAGPRPRRPRRCRSPGSSWTCRVRRCPRCARASPRPGSSRCQRLGADQLRRGVDRAGAAQQLAGADAGDEQDQHRHADRGSHHQAAQAPPPRARAARLARRHRLGDGRPAAASARTVAIRFSRSARRRGAAARPRPAAGRPPARASAAASRQRSQPSRWRSSAPASSRVERPERVGGEVVAQLRAIAIVAHGSTSEGPSIPIRSASVTRIFSKPEPHPALHGTQRHPQHLGDLGVGEAAEVGEPDHLATAPRGSSLQRAAHLARGLAADRLRVGELARRAATRAPRRRRGRASAPSPRSAAARRSPGCGRSRASTSGRCRGRRRSGRRCARPR